MGSNKSIHTQSPSKTTAPAVTAADSKELARRFRQPSILMSPNVKVTSWSQSHADDVKMSHVWIVKDFPDLLHKNSEKFRSPVFTFGKTSTSSGPRFKGSIDIYPNGDKEEDYLSVFVNLENTTGVGHELEAAFSLSILDARGEVSNTRKCKRRPFKKGSGWGYSTYKKRDLLLAPSSNLLQNEGKDLVLLCEIAIWTKKVEVIESSQWQGIITDEGPINRLQQNLRTLFETELCSDVVLIVGSKEKQPREFPVHKCLLAAASPVFAAMFSNGLAETTGSTVVIPDVQPEAMEQLLTFIYSGQQEQKDTGHSSTEDDEYLLVAVFQAADKYGVLDLKVEVEATLSKTLTVGNVARRVMLADSHDAPVLRRSAFQFILEKSASYPDIAAEVFEVIPHQK